MHVLLLWLSSILLYEVHTHTHVTKMVSLLIGMRFLHTSLFNLNLFFYRKCDQPDLQVCRAIFLHNK